MTTDVIHGELDGRREEIAGSIRERLGHLLTGTPDEREIRILRMADIQLRYEVRTGNRPARW